MSAGLYRLNLNAQKMGLHDEAFGSLVPFYGQQVQAVRHTVPARPVEKPSNTRSRVSRRGVAALKGSERVRVMVFASFWMWFWIAHPYFGLNYTT